MGVFDRAKDLGGRGFKAGFSTMGDFQKFIMRGNVVDLAIGVIIGAAFGTVVTALVKDIISPLIPVSGGLFKWTQTIGYATFLFGDFLNTLLSFLIIALVVYFFVVKPINAMQETYDRVRPKQPVAPTKRDCPYCLSEIPLQATRCAFCTSPLPPSGQGIPQAQV